MLGALLFVSASLVACGPVDEVVVIPPPPPKVKYVPPAPPSQDPLTEPAQDKANEGALAEAPKSDKPSP